MLITEDMIHRGVKKATELALLPRTGQIEDFATNDELMLEILQAALDGEFSGQGKPDFGESRK
ncbi:MAG: hypothetical protein ACO1NO_05160 [Burkholderiaceae bacterium]